MYLNLNKFQLDLSQPRIMGILNVTPDSFSDGGHYFNKDKAIAHAQQMIDEGADIIDIGGESTRPGAQAVAVEDELARVLPVIDAIKDLKVPVSIDTSKAEVMQAAVECGASLINDVNALRSEGALETAAKLEVPVCLMHMQGTPRTMQENPHYGDVVSDIRHFFQNRIEAVAKAGIDKSRIILDPGFGFGKTLQNNIDLLNRLKEFSGLGLPLLIGLSRKRFLGALTGKETADRTVASVCAAMIAAQNGASILRVHDVAETKEMLNILKVVE